MRDKGFKIVTAIAGVYHILLAAAGLLCPVEMVAKVVDTAFGVVLEVSPQLGLVAKFASVYMLAFGVMLIVLSVNPVKYRAFAMPALILFGLRLVNRIVFFNTLTDAGMPLYRNVVGTGIILVLFVAILSCLPNKQSEVA